MDVYEMFMVAEYFTKLMEDEALASISLKVVQTFI
jgi:hypothetical protein